ncbi:LLM class flavin-dependent oxidoreductase [Salarchaeum sp. JOR-1]|uniref:LLM class flavin-dependent oxidoreductase n=1 Tax=Salarchaeum sp. JOR-1 TaxID=2599399 RepID=UPI0011984B5A|nr:LLM class flavin-dependent oxidoreductase [Salarchaeum sp. JOR-1]QDX40938.1 LLM class flavin-dependent oxidoreductase [Salarchaeum sp. JOR-1]
MRASVQLTGDDPVGFAERAEDLGYRGVWTGELWGTDAFVTLARIAERTDIDVGTSIVNAYSRSPAALAGAAASVSEATSGQVTLGVGTSTEKAVEDLHGVEFANPPRRLHEAIELARRFLETDERVSYDGELFSVRDFRGLDADVPVYAAALGPATRRATGRVADGWLPHNIPFECLEPAFELVARTAREAGRDPGDIDVVPYVPAAVSEDRAEAYDALRGHLAYYVGSADGYKNAVAQSFPDEADAVADAWRSGDRAAARGHVSDEMVDALGVAGTPDEARERLREVAAIPVVDEPLVVTPSNASADLAERTVAALAPTDL